MCLRFLNLFSHLVFNAIIKYINPANLETNWVTLNILLNVIIQLVNAGQPLIFSKYH